MKYLLHDVNRHQRSSSSCFLLGLPQMLLPQVEPPVLQEPPVQMELQAVDPPPHPIPAATAGYSRHRPKSRRWGRVGQTKILAQNLIVHAVCQEHYCSWRSNSHHCLNNAIFGCLCTLLILETLAFKNALFSGMKCLVFLIQNGRILCFLVFICYIYI